MVRERRTAEQAHGRRSSTAGAAQRNQLAARKSSRSPPVISQPRRSAAEGQVAVTTGRVALTDAGAVEPVVEAAAGCLNAAPRGPGTWIEASTRDLLAERFAFRRRGASYELVGPAGGAARPSATPRPVGRDAVGRDAELRFLVEALAADGTPRGVVLPGELGIGESRLTEAVTARLLGTPFHAVLADPASARARRLDPRRWVGSRAVAGCRGQVPIDDDRGARD